MSNYRWLIACSAIACLIPLGGLAYQDSGDLVTQETVAVPPAPPALPSVPAAPAAPLSDRLEATAYGYATAPANPFNRAAPAQLAYTLRSDGQSEGNLIRQIKEAENDEEREAAIDEARQELEEVYDQYLESSEQQIEQLEKQLEELRSHLEKRREAKSRLVDLKLELLISQADGIGWPGDGRFPGGGAMSVFSSPSFPFQIQGEASGRRGAADSGLRYRVQQEVERARAVEEAKEAIDAIERSERARLRRGR